MVSPPILLHIASTAVQVTTVDPAVFTAALAALVIACIGIWLPRSLLSVPALRQRRNRRRARAAATGVLVFLALLPSVVPYDHLFAHDSHADGEEAAVHASHCHVSPGTCSDAPVTSGPGQLLLSDALVVEPSMLSTLVAPDVALLVGITSRPEIHPPLCLVA